MIARSSLSATGRVIAIYAVRSKMARQGCFDRAPRPVGGERESGPREAPAYPDSCVRGTAQRARASSFAELNIPSACTRGMPTSGETTDGRASSGWRQVVREYCDRPGLTKTHYQAQSKKARGDLRYYQQKTHLRSLPRRVSGITRTSAFLSSLPLVASDSGQGGSRLRYLSRLDGSERVLGDSRVST